MNRIETSETFLKMVLAAALIATLLFALPGFLGSASAEIDETSVSLTAVSGPTGDDAELSLSIPAAITLGLVEGFTEYLPVSSTGHLLIANEILGLKDSNISQGKLVIDPTTGAEVWQPDAGGATMTLAERDTRVTAAEAEAETALDTYAIGIQAGAIAAVFVLYRQRIREMMLGLVGRSVEGRKVLLAVIAAFIPTAVLGVLYLLFVQDALFGAVPIAAAWVVGGVAILVLTRLGLLKADGFSLAEITMRQAAIIGLAQAIAMWPGVSRSLVTIVAGVLIGLSVAAAVEFAFLLGLVTLGAATALTAVKDGPELVSLFGWVSPLVGLIVAFLAALVSIKWMVSWLQTKGLNIFGYYRIVIGLLTFGAIGAGWV